MKNIVITGGRGFLSYELVREFSQNPDIKIAVATSNIGETLERLKPFNLR